MDVYEALRTRFSVRAYKDSPVEADKLRRVLDAGRIAPSGRNSQSWKFVVVQDAELRGALAKAAEQPFLAKAPVIIGIVGLTPEDVMFCGVPADPMNCAIAIDHMTLAAVAEGLGTCWIGHFDQDTCCELLGVPPTAKIVEMLALGYPDAEMPEKSRKAFEKVVCFEQFG